MNPTGAGDPADACRWLPLADGASLRVQIDPEAESTRSPVPADEIEAEWVRLCADNPRYFNGPILEVDEADAARNLVRVRRGEFKHLAGAPRGRDRRGAARRDGCARGAGRDGRPIRSARQAERLDADLRGHVGARALGGRGSAPDLGAVDGLGRCLAGAGRGDPRGGGPRGRARPGPARGAARRPDRAQRGSRLPCADRPPGRGAGGRDGGGDEPVGVRRRALARGRRVGRVCAHRAGHPVVDRDLARARVGAPLQAHPRVRGHRLPRLAEAGAPRERAPRARRVDPRRHRAGRVSMRTVQDTVERAVRTVLRERVVLKGASRTDSGVHAGGFFPDGAPDFGEPGGQVAAFTTEPDPAKGVGWPDRARDGRARARAQRDAAQRCPVPEGGGGAARLRPDRGRRREGVHLPDRDGQRARCGTGGSCSTPGTTSSSSRCSGPRP
jgi:hypothetical protein